MRYFKRHLVTSALPYANGPLHIGHLAGAYLSADIYVRFLRLMDKEVAFICGSDEHGAAITIRAAKEGKTPQEIVDTYHELFKDTFDKIGISFDIYHRTSEALHHETAQDFFRVLNEKGEFVEKESEQYYDEEAKQFLADRYIKGTCPKCDYEEAYGDQCESCGSTLSPTELINPASTITGNKPILKKTTHWFLPLDKYQTWLKEWIETGKLDGKELHDPQDWKNHVLGQCKSWIEGGLHPRAMTRDLSWGVDVPSEIPGSEGKKLYVWLDAPIGYISATKQWAMDHDKDWKPYWQDEETELVHFIGKDNIVFHCLIFPAILKAHGDYILPYNVPANQFLNLEGKKISTSRNWAVWIHDFVTDMPEHIDALRYAMVKNMPEIKDSEFTWKGFQDYNNNELVNNLANYVNRVVVLVNKYYEGKVPEFDENQDVVGVMGEMETSYHDSELLSLFDKLHVFCNHVRKYDFRSAMNTLMDISSNGNQILQFNEPWKAVKDNPELVKAVMNLSLQYVTAISVAVRPFMPETSDKIRTLLNLPQVKEEGELLKMLDQLAEGNHLIQASHQISKSDHLFSRIDDETIAGQVSKLEAMSVAATEAAGTASAAKPDQKENIAYDDFMKMEIRTATVLEAEKVKKADKLLKLKLDLGYEQRTVVSGIAEHFTPQDVIGKKVSLLANLEPRKIRGVESQGMILMAEGENGKLGFVSPEEGWPDGMTIR
jgi:methionyl-tRNA synthetase